MAQIIITEKKETIEERACRDAAMRGIYRLQDAIAELKSAGLTSEEIKKTLSIAIENLLK